MSPTTDEWIRAELFLAELYVGTVSTRYQYQTWGGDRPPESRLTSNLGPIRDKAAGGDLLIIRRALESLRHYRLVLIKKGSAAWDELEATIKGRAWGVVGVDSPISQADYETAKSEEDGREAQPFELFEKMTRVTESRVKRVARSLVFRERVREQYQFMCCVCRTGVRTPDESSEIEAAHIVPRQHNGSDDARNGLGLCRRHHWAFDHGLWAVDDDRKVVVPLRVKKIPENKLLVEFDGEKLAGAKDKTLIASVEALRWHRTNIAGRYT